uniref:Calponin-homology (CH) domain-containing protein n=1 Tax=Chelonoidis abingdonii TaxID=106734 RepID=A0A8C0GNY7_CHEAB
MRRSCETISKALVKSRYTTSTENLEYVLYYSESENMLENEWVKKDEADSQSQERENKFQLSLFPDEDTEEYIFFQKVITAVQNWFTLFGWSKGPNPISIPHSLRRDVCKIQMTSSDEKVIKQNLGKDTKTVYDMLLHLSGQLLPGITSSQSLPSDPIERVIQLHWQHSTMLTFLNQGACLPHVMPEFLLEPDEYKKWIGLQIALKVIVLVLARVSSLTTSNLLSSESPQSMPRINAEPLSSNIYSSSERLLLTWLNTHYEKTRKIVWKDCQKVPPMRWIVNFDRDLLDGLVLAAQVAAYCPYLISTHFTNMYTNPGTPEQCLHNCLILVNLQNLGIYCVLVLGYCVCKTSFNLKDSRVVEFSIWKKLKCDLCVCPCICMLARTCTTLDYDTFGSRNYS